MITIRLLGGCGNQMFQRAYGIALEHKGFEVGYDRTHLVEGTHREYSLGGFDSPVKFAGDSGPIISEASMLYQEAYANPPQHCTMAGYWQTEQYFKNSIPQVLQAFKFKEPLSPWAATYRDEIRNACCDTAFLHVRRQDYVYLQHVHGMPTMDYYKEAIAQLPEHVAIYVFSDDIEWCQGTFRDRHFQFVTHTTKFEDLQLMKACKHAIIANSSFSWWGAYLGDDQENRTVIAPKQWFNPATGIADTDIVPGRWRKI
jgi:Glycosyl transferase family 11